MAGESRSISWKKTVPFLFLNIVGLALILWRVEAGRTPPGELVLVETTPKAETVTSEVGEIRFAFGSQLDPETVGPKALQIQPAVAGRVDIEDGRILKLSLHEPLARATRYTILLDDKVRGIHGETAPKATKTYTTQPLMILGASQARIEKDHSAILSVRFNMPVNPLRLLDHIKLTWPDNKVIEPELAGQQPAEEVLLRIPYATFDTVQLAIDENLVGVEGPIPMGEAFKQKIGLTARLRFLGMVGDYDYYSQPKIEIRTNHPLDTSGAAAKISIEPNVKFSCEGWSRGLRVQGKFKPGTRYTVTLKPGLNAGAAGSLEEEITRSVWFGSRPPMIRFPFGGGYLSEKGKLLVPLHTVNLDKVQLKSQRLYPNNLVEYVLSQHNSAPGMLGPKAKEEVLDIEPTRDEEVETILDLRKLSGNAPRGVFALEARSKEDYWRRDRAVMICTDIGLTARLGNKSALVWATSLAGAKPLGEVNLTLYSDRRQVLGNGTTDAQGLAQFDLSEAPEGESPAMIVAESSDGDLSYLKLQGNNRSLQGVSIDGRPWMRRGYEAYCYAERGVYRPGDAVRFTAFVRQPGWEVPPEMPLILHVKKPDGREMFKQTIKTDSQGRLLHTFKLPDTALTGRYQIALTLPGAKDEIGATAVRIADYIPQRLRMKLESSATNKKLTLKGQVNYLFGDPAPNLQTDCRVVWKTASFAPKGDDWKGWTFNDSRVKFSRRTVHPSDRFTNEEGGVVYALSVPSMKTQGILQATATIEAREKGGRALTESITEKVYPFPFYLGAKTESSTIVPQMPIAIALAALTPESAVQTGTTDYEARLLRIDYVNVLRRSSNGRLRYDWTERSKLVTATSGTLQDGRGTVSLTPEVAGTHRLIVTSKTGCAVTYNIWVDGPGASYAMADPESLSLKLDKERYKAGETAVLSIRAPFTGQALLTIESDHVLHQQVLTLDKEESTLTIDVKDTWRPNVYARLTVVRPVVAEEDWQPHRADGAARLLVDNADRKLTVTVDAPKSVRPDGTLQVKLKVQEGETPIPGAAVTFAAVDEGVLALTRHPSPSAWSWFYAPRRLEVNGYDMYNRLAPELAKWVVRDKAAPGGGRGFNGASLADDIGRRLNPIEAKRVETAVLYTGTLTTNDAGEAEATFTVPSYIGELRIMAIAAQGPRFGDLTQALPVRSPIMYEASWPRALAPGDRFEPAITVFNRTGNFGNIALNLTMNDKLSATEAPPTHVAVAADKEKTTYLNLVAGKIGKATARIEVELDGERFGQSVEIPVRPPVALAREGGYVIASSEDSATVTIPDLYLPGTAKTRLVVAGSPLVELTGALDYLMQYPYGCAEQTTSRLIPLIYLRDLAALNAPQSVGQEELDELVRRGLLRLRMMQTYNGGLAYWSGKTTPDPWVSVYAADMMLEAKKAGYEIPETLHDGLLRYIDEHIDDWTQSSNSNTRNFTTASYGCYVLARAGRPAYQWMASLEELVQKSEETKDAPGITTTGRFFLAAAYLACGERDGANSLISGTQPGIATRTSGGNLASPVREQAIMLSVLLDVDAQSARIPALVETIRKRTHLGRWGTTQENAFALMALGKYLRRTGGAPEGNGSLVLPDGKEIPFSLRKGIMLDTLKPGTSVTVRTDSSKSYAYWSVEGVPADGKAKEEDRDISIRREFLNADGNAAIDPKALKQGELYRVRLTIATKRDASGTTVEISGPYLIGRPILSNLVITDVLPAGLELEDTNLQGTASRSTGNTFDAVHVERRDDRVIIFGNMRYTSSQYTYLVRAVTPGTFTLPAAEISCMYDPDIYSVHGRGTVEVSR